jgi:Zn-dependent peptidase ImmA (M78 family)
MPQVRPEILRWARETAGLAVAEAAEKIELREARGVSRADRLTALEAGLGEPTRPMLVRMAAQYRRPLLAFYLSAPPRKGNRGQDFRTLPQEYSGSSEPVLDVLLREIVARQSLLRSALEVEGEPEVRTWVASASTEAGVSTLVSRLRTTLGLTAAEFRATPDVESAFRLLRERVEDQGVFVVFVSNLGSHHTSLSVDVFRGMAVADPIAPLIIINDQDSKTAWSFTLLHELAHLWLGFTGVSGGSFDRAVERFCNEVASEFLLPADELRSIALARVLDPEVLNAQVSNVPAASEGRGGSNSYVLGGQRLGDALLQTTGRLIRSGAITTTKAATILGVKPGNVQPLMMAGSNTSARFG